MALNWTIEVLWYFLGSIMNLINAIIFGWNAISKKNKSVMYLFLSLIVFSVFFLFTSLAFLFMDINIYRLTHYLAMLGIFFFLIFINRTSRVTINPLVIGFICALTSLILLLSFYPESIIIYYGFGYPSLKTSGILSFMGNFALMFYSLSANYWSLKILMKAPKELKKPAVVLFIGTLLTFIAYLIWSIQYLLGIPLGIIVNGIGSFIVAIAIIKEPKVLYILPFTAYRLVVIHGKYGISLFNYIWSEEKIDNEIFSGLLFALQKSSIEVLKKGEMELITLENGILILKRSENITVGLLSSKCSSFLVDCIGKFTKEFEKKYQHYLSSKIYRTDQFNSAIELVEKYFANVPSKIEALT